MMRPIKTRRRVRTRSALFLAAISQALLLTLATLRTALGMRGGAALLWQVVTALLSFALPAFVGLLVLDGDQRALLPTRALSAAQGWHLACVGVELICPMALLTAMSDTLLVRMGLATAAVSAAPPASALFVPSLLVSALLVPIVEELFFRGYLLGVLTRVDRRGALAATALLFAAAHGLNAGFLSRALLGYLLGALVFATGSLVAPMLVHGCYNATVLVLEYAGLAQTLMTLRPLTCALLLGGCVALWRTLALAWHAQGTREALHGGFAAPLTRREAGLCVAAVLALLVSLLLPGVSP